MRPIRSAAVGVVALVVLFQGVSVAFADELPALYRGVRPLGMGGAFITLSNDENALFYNPAGLNDVKGFGGVGILNPEGAASKESLKLYHDIKGVEGTNTTQVIDLLQKHVGEHVHAGAALFPHVYLHNFAIGVLGQGTMDIEVRNPAFPEAVTDVKADAGGVVGGAIGLWDQTVQLGATGKYVQREGIKRTFQPTDIVVNFDPFANRVKAHDFAFDAGIKLNAPVLLKPSVAVVLQNITDLDFGALGVIPQQLNVGAGIHPNFWILDNSLVVEVDDVTKQAGTDKDFYKRVHMGAEVKLPKILALRAGVNQGYYTAGATIDLWILKLAAATYAEEVGAFAGQRADRRYVAQLSLGF
ncbi:MAG: hypothetical protein HY207_11110 [Nitrospirae bacterium]|nr:hypothetical protein [Nitrospirota bacterium]